MHFNCLLLLLSHAYILTLIPVYMLNFSYVTLKVYNLRFSFWFFAILEAVTGSTYKWNQWIHSYHVLPLLISLVTAFVALLVIGNLSAYMMGQYTNFVLWHECGLMSKCHVMADVHYSFLWGLLNFFGKRAILHMQLHERQRTSQSHLKEVVAEKKFQEMKQIDLVCLPLWTCQRRGRTSRDYQVGKIIADSCCSQARININ